MVHDQRSVPLAASKDTASASVMQKFIPLLPRPSRNPGSRGFGIPLKLSSSANAHGREDFDTLFSFSGSNWISKLVFGGDFDFPVIDGQQKHIFVSKLFLKGCRGCFLPVFCWRSNQWQTFLAFATRLAYRQVFWMLSQTNMFFGWTRDLLSSRRGA
jgi:hypothetical protein